MERAPGDHLLDALQHELVLRRRTRALEPAERRHAPVAEQAGGVRGVLARVTDPAVTNIQHQVRTDDAVHRAPRQPVGERRPVRRDRDALEQGPVDRVAVGQGQEVEIIPEVRIAIAGLGEQPFDAMTHAGRVDLGEHRERDSGARPLPLHARGEAARRVHALGGEPVGEAHQDGVLLCQPREEGPVDVGEVVRGDAVPEQQPERQCGEALLARQGAHAANRSPTRRATACWAACRSSFLMTRAPRTQGNTVR